MINKVFSSGISASNMCLTRMSNQSYYTKSPMLKSDSLELSFKGKPKVNEIPDELNNILTKLANTKDNDEMDDVLVKSVKNVGDFVEIDPVTYKYKDFQLQSALDCYAEDQVDNLKIVNSFGISSAPQLVKYLKIGSDDAVIVTKIPESDGAEIVPINRISEPPSKKSLNEFFKDMKTIADEGYIYNSSRPAAGLLVNQNNGKILINDWRPLQKADKNKVNQKMSELANYLLEISNPSNY